MNKKDYAEYEAAVAAFFESEGINNLSTGEPWCDSCDKKVDWGHDGTCPDCGTEVEYKSEPYCSSRGCDCCGCSLQQMLEFASGYNDTTGDIQEYQICEDCVYYAVYGVLDDGTMFDIENS